MISITKITMIMMTMVMMIFVTIVQEFLDAMHQFAGQTPEDKIKFLFKVYDIDGQPFFYHFDHEMSLRYRQRAFS